LATTTRGSCSLLQIATGTPPPSSATTHTGAPIAIAAPDGQRTILTLDANGYLATITNPAGETHRMTYTADGLLTRYTDGTDNLYHYVYDDQGRLTRDTNPVGGDWTLARKGLAEGHRVTLTTAEGRSTSQTEQ